MRHYTTESENSNRYPQNDPDPEPIPRPKPSRLKNLLISISVLSILVIGVILAFYQKSASPETCTTATSEEDTTYQIKPDTCSGIYGPVIKIIERHYSSSSGNGLDSDGNIKDTDLCKVFVYEIDKNKVWKTYDEYWKYRYSDNSFLYTEYKKKYDVYGKIIYKFSSDKSDEQWGKTNEAYERDYDTRTVVCTSISRRWNCDDKETYTKEVYDIHDNTIYRYTKEGDRETTYTYQYDYDDKGRVLSEKEYSGDNGNRKLISQSTYQYDSSGNETYWRHDDIDDQESNVIKKVYDKQGNLITEKEYAGTPGKSELLLKKTNNYKYQDGVLIHEETVDLENGTSEETKYNLRGDVISRGKNIFEYKYDANGHLIYSKGIYVDYFIEEFYERDKYGNRTKKLTVAMFNDGHKLYDLNISAYEYQDGTIYDPHKIWNLKIPTE